MARTIKQPPTMRSVIASIRSRFFSSTSIESRQRSAAPEVTSIKLSKPKPTSAMLPAISPDRIATSPSSKFHAMVKYSSWRPRLTRFARSSNRLSDGFPGEVAGSLAGVILIGCSISSPQKPLFLKNLVLNAAGEDQGEEQKSKRLVDQKRPEGVKIEEDKDRVARERKHPGRHQTARRLRVNAYAPRRAERDQRQNENGAAGRHQRDPGDLRRQRIQELPLQRRRKDSPIERQRHGKDLSRPKREDHEEPDFDHTPQSTFAHAERERVDVSGKAQEYTSAHEDEKEDG